MELSQIQENEAVVIAEMFIRQEIDNNVDDYILLEDGNYLLLEDESVIYKEF